MAKKKIPSPKKKSAAPKPATAVPSPKPSTAVDKPSKRSALRQSILARKTAAKPIAFSFAEVKAIAKSNSAKTAAAATAAAKATGKAVPAKPALTLEKNAKPNHIKAASLADILGFNPKKAKSTDDLQEKDVPEKFKRYYRLLVDLRTRLTEGIERHSEESLKRSAKDDAGDLSAYGQNMAEGGGINTFDRDFALSLVSSEQEALSEIDGAIKRIRAGTYGICEITGKPIAKERLLAVPFTRYSADAQKELEKNRYRSRSQAGIFGEMSEEGGKIMEDDAGGDE